MDPTARFSGRTGDYARFRPDYPEALFAELARQGAAPGALVADFGAGTGILARRLHALGCSVVAIEPNAEMAAAARRAFAGAPRAGVVRARAEACGLAAASVDLAVAAQAYHWFDPAMARAEFARILRPAGRIALVWNERRAAGTPFLEGFERLLLRFGTDYVKVRDQARDLAAIGVAFGGTAPAPLRFENHQDLDLEGVLGRLRSASFLPHAGAPEFAALAAAASDLFRATERGGLVRIEYDTVLYGGAPAR